MIRLRKLIALLIMTAFFALPAHAVDPCNYGSEMGKEEYVPIAKRYEKGLFFVIEKCGIEPSYIMGTIHTDNPEVIDHISDAFEIIRSSDSASFETLFFGKDVEDQLDASFYGNNTVETLPDIIGASYYDKFARIIAEDYPEFNEMNFYKMKPWAAAILLQYPKKTGSGKIMDEQLQEYAQRREVKVHGIESGKELVSFFAKLKEQEAIEFFRFSVDKYQDSKRDIDKMTEAYMESDLKKIRQIADASIKELKWHGLLKGFEEKIIIRRNHKMARRINPYLKKGGAFIAVGALHLPGKEGVLALLEKKGYHINIMRTRQEIFEDSLR